MNGSDRTNERDQGMLRGLDLFSGIGGLSIALSEWVIPQAYCEIERYAQAVLLSRMSENKLFLAPIWDDITTLKKDMLPGIDLVYGGFPCQDISVAGNGAGLAGKRSGLFFEVCRVVEEIKPRFVFLENVPAIRTRGLREVVKAFTDLGYDCRWTCVSAAEVGAWHLRKRWFLLAHSNSESKILGCPKKRFQNLQPIGDSSEQSVAHSSGSGSWHKQGRRSGESGESTSQLIYHGSEKHVAHVGREGLERQWERPLRVSKEHQVAGDSSRWAFEPDVGRVVYGLPRRMDRIKGLGNSVVPLQAKTAFIKLMGL